MNYKKISAISFDLWDTLIKDSPQMGENRSEYRINEILILLSKINSKITLENIKISLNYIREQCTEDHKKGIDINFDNRVNQLIEKISQKEKIVPHPLFKNLHIAITRSSATFGGYPCYVLRRFLYIACFTMNTIL